MGTATAKTTAEPLAIRGVAIPEAFRAAAEVVLATLRERHKPDTAKADQLRDRLHTLRHDIAEAEARLKQLRQLYGEYSRQLMAIERADEAVETEALRILAQLSGGVIQATKGAARTPRSGAPVTEKKWRIVLDGEELTGSAGQSPSNLAWYKFGHVPVGKLYEACEAQTGIRPGSADHRGPLTFTFDGHTITLEMSRR
jgi:TolA-binding protein